MWALIFVLSFSSVPQYAEIYDTKAQCETALLKIPQSKFFTGAHDMKGKCVPLMKP